MLKNCGEICEICMANNRNNDGNPKVIDDDGNLLTDKTQVVEKWKRDCDDAGECQRFDRNHETICIVQLLENYSNDGSIFPKADCSSLIMSIRREEIKQPVYKMGRAKRICVFEHSVMTNFNCACTAIQRSQGSGFLSEGSSWFTACMSEQRRFWRDCADAQARLNLRCSHRR